MQLGIFLVLRGWLGYDAHAYLASTHARFYKELDGEMPNKRPF